MLKSLHVENIALIDNIDINFEPGLNIITGETGAGKSIIIDALGSAIGEKIAADSLRKGTKKAVTECVFQINSNSDLKSYLLRNDIEDFDSSLILRKESSETGRNRAFVNDTPATNTTLLEIGNLLVDLHGQHEHQALLKTKHHINYLDAFGGYNDLLTEVEQNFNRYIILKDELNKLKQREKILSEKSDLFKFQIEEIKNVNPLRGEDGKLIQEEKLLGNSEKRFQLASEITENLYDKENSIFDNLSQSLNRFEELSRIDPKLENIRKDCEAAQVAVQEIAKFMQSYLQNVEMNPDQLAAIRERLGQFSFLKRKYSKTTDEIIAYKESIERELLLIENHETAIKDKQTEVAKQVEKLSQLCFLLSQRRQATALKLQKLVLEQLNELGMSKAQFAVNIEKVPDEKGIVELSGIHYKTSNLGIDKVEFFIVANPGEDLKPLARVASGGEISRIMLALKSSLAKVDKISVLIFDEIDNGISGRIAQAVGLSLKRLSKTHQIICITHLPQIASVGDFHYVVEKVSENESTKTLIRKLQDEEKAIEIAKLLSGESLTETQINSARELIEDAKRSNISPQ
jgi:DNA repair protein RecN (Recombination protein N)